MIAVKLIKLSSIICEIMIHPLSISQASLSGIEMGVVVKITTLDRILS